MTYYANSLRGKAEIAYPPSPFCVLALPSCVLHISNVCVRDCVCVCGCEGFSVSAGAWCVWVVASYELALNSAEQIPTHFSMEDCF